MRRKEGVGRGRQQDHGHASHLVMCVLFRTRRNAILSKDAQDSRALVTLAVRVRPARISGRTNHRRRRRQAAGPLQQRPKPQLAARHG